jgi:DNA-directed RNA polymerase subunit RPC12/RpoP
MMFYQDNGTGLRDIMTVVQCPDCLHKFAVRLGIDYLVRHQGEQLRVVCMECGQKRILRVK